jgi:uncharacterized protein
MFPSKKDHLDPGKGPKRILSLDGGGIRGILTLQFLRSIEAIVQQRLGEDALLCDYFDLIGGTSTGSIIAAGLACGMKVHELEDLYRKLGSDTFRIGGAARLLPAWLRGKLSPKFLAGPLQRELEDQLGADTTLDSDKIRTGLMIMTKRLDTGSPWPLHNSGRGRYATEDGAMRLAQVVRASTAAPTYFAPEEIEVRSRNGAKFKGAFVDGGVSPFNDPALQLLMLASLQGHGFCWPMGREQLLIVSVGTGRFQESRPERAMMVDPAALQGIYALQSLMDDCERTNRAILQWLTDCLTPWLVDRTVGDMKLDSQVGPQIATYVRYNVLLEQAWLSAELGVEYTRDKVKQIRQMDDPSNLMELATLGHLAAAKQVKPEHLPPLFDIASV